MRDMTPVDDKIGLYYGLGHGVNKAEALRQDFIFKKASIEINWNDPELVDDLESLYEIMEELAEMAGAKVLTGEEN